ncbi:MAG TPA: ATP-binding cassette domain-containing protein, partial [Roseateles sp.]|nr:ATP-binding cassette domain-containing protein [Roseateles sp.]
MSFVHEIDVLSAAALSREALLRNVAPAPVRGGVGLALHGLAKRYGAREVLRTLDLRIAPGEFVAIVGRSGCGKSTLLRLLAGLDQPSGGQLLAGSGALNAVREDIRLMFQD